MAFTAKTLSWRFRYLNIVGCLLKRRPTKEGGVTGIPGPPPLATPLVVISLTVHNPLFSVHKLRLNKLMQCFYWSITSQ